MLICPAVHIPTRSLLRSSSTPEPSDPLYSIVFFFNKAWLQMHSSHLLTRRAKREPERRRSSLNGSTSPKHVAVIGAPYRRSGRRPSQPRGASGLRPRSSSVAATGRRAGSPRKARRAAHSRASTPQNHAGPEKGGLSGRACQTHTSSIMILPQVHLRKPCYDFYFL